jgi:DNA-binding NtrC family response regulator
MMVSLNRALMAAAHRFVIVDSDIQTRVLLSRTLLRKHPDAQFEHCEDFEAAAEILKAITPDQSKAVVVAHATPQIQGRELITALRALHPSIPIVWVGDSAHSHSADAAGATRFLDRNAWLLIGEAVKGL